MISKLLSLRKYFIKIGLKYEYELVNRLIKICSIPGVDAPADEITVDPDDIYEHLRDTGGEGPGRPNGDILIDSPRKTKKRFGQKNYKEMPFHYGEFTEIINPSDDMGWDVIIVPSENIDGEDNIDEFDVEIPMGNSGGEAGGFQLQMLKKDLEHEGGSPMLHIPAGHKLIPVGKVPVEDDQSKWDELAGGKRAPVGNDKFILAPDGKYNESDVKIIEDFFDTLWNFKSVQWFDKYSPISNEEWPLGSDE